LQFKNIFIYYLLTGLKEIEIIAFVLAGVQSISPANIRVLIFLNMENTGKENSGDWNSGDWNSGE
jgi:hypothetical protein